MGNYWSAEETAKLLNLAQQGLDHRSIAGQLGRSQDAIRRKLDRQGLRSSEPSAKVGVERTEHGDESFINMTTSTPVRTVEEAMRKAEVDSAVWEPERFLVNSWETAAVIDGAVTKTPLWQVKLWLRRRKGHSPQEMLRMLTEALASPRSRVRSRARNPTGTLAEVSIMDHHFGKLAWAPEVGENYDLKIAEARYRRAAGVLLNDCRSANRIAVVVGNDFFHVDRGTNTTTSGTVVHADGRWQQAFIAGCKCLRDVIDEAAEIADVDVVVIPGNHDFEKIFTLGVVLGAIYEGNGRVVVHNAPNHKKRLVWGTNLIGFLHGHNMPRRRFEALPNEMAALWPDDWQKTTWREWHLGHVHSEHEDVWRFRASESLGTVIVRRLPSLCGQDAWHYENGYRSLGAAEAHFYDHRYGRVGYRSVSQLELEEAQHEIVAAA